MTPKFQVGERVKIDLRVQGGHALPGEIREAKVKFPGTEYEKIRYKVEIDEPFCEERLWTVAERWTKRENGTR